MFKRFLCLAAAIPSITLGQTPDPTPALRDAALQDEVAWSIVEGLTTEVGQRLAGTEAEARARVWAVTKLNALGFANVHVEPFDMPVWVRGAETAEITAPFPQRLAITALGNSGATPPAGITAEIVHFDGLAALQAADPASVRAKIVFVTHRMAATQDGSSYGAFGVIRRTAPSVAAAKGAVGIVIRSIGTDHHRVPHTGVQSWAAGVRPIPAAALSVPDAELIEHMLARGQPVSLHLILTPRQTGVHPSGNVVAEVPGSDPGAGIVLIGGHLDSWDLATGAIDDGAGIAITTAAAKRLLDAPVRPRRTIRIVWFGAEEEGGFGGDAYRNAHRGEHHAMVAESDFGADRVWQFAALAADPKDPLIDRVAAALLPLGIAGSTSIARGGSDVGPIAAALGLPVIDLRQDGTRYFEIHHTADDTLDKIDPAQLRQNVAAWTAMLSVMANSAAELGATPPRPEE